MKTVNSLSGGKTSSYLAVKYPADYELFALVCNDDPKCSHPDKKLMQMANDRLNKYCPQFGEFIGTPEHPSIIEIIFKLEQKIGKEIIWLRGRSFDKLIEYKKALPNQNTRWCTTLMKIDPIFWFCYLYTDFPVKMRVGFRFDEQERAKKLTDTYEFPIHCNNYGTHRQKLQQITWRVGDYPLIEDKVFRLDIEKYWQDSTFPFPLDSNCQMCFWKNEAQLRQNFDDAPNVMNWAKDQEEKMNRRFRFKMKMKNIEKLGIQESFLFGGGSGCESGYCTD